MAQTIQTPKMPVQVDPDRARATVSKILHDHGRLYLFEGIVLIALGFAAIVVPAIASVAITLLIGWLFLIGGGMGLGTTLIAKHAPGFWYSILSAMLAIAAGALLLWSPLTSVLTLTLVMAAYFIAEGIASIMFALSHRRENTASWGWLLVSGIVDLGLAAFIVSGLPGAAAWAIGLIVGINLMFGGSALVAVAIGARKPSD
jgi:uncharacterized membrane protein HdeD (DUF308 family)